MQSMAAVMASGSSVSAGAPAIVVRGASKSYGSTRALARVDVEVPGGTVFGVLGPNGAGKTTLLRAVLGLVRLDEGKITTAGSPAGSTASLGACGALIERPAFVPALSGVQNLEVLARARGVPTSRVHEVLEVVGLGGRGKDSFRSYSVGMGQRLGIAGALLGRPSLLILDEPTSGLDPDGVVAVRQLIRDLAEGGTTVVFSSHVLTEVERVCDRVLVLRSGSVVADAPVRELRSTSHDVPVQVVATPRARAVEVLAGQGLRVPDGVPPDGVITVRTVIDGVPDLVRALVAADVAVHRVVPQESDLETLFFSLIHENTEEPS